MSPYNILPHRADLKIEFFGQTKEELFSEALRGMFESIEPQFVFQNGEAKKVEREIKIKSSDSGNMLIEFLNEALYLSDINNETYIAAEFKRLTETELEAKIFGQKISGFSEEIKAVTYHGLKIGENDKGWKAVVLFDT